MQAIVGGTVWEVTGVQHNKTRRKIYTKEGKKLDCIEHTITLHFESNTDAKFFFSGYEKNEEVRIDIVDEDRYTGKKHLENNMKAKRIEGASAVFEREKVMGNLSGELFNGED